MSTDGERPQTRTETGNNTSRNRGGNGGEGAKTAENINKARAENRENSQNKQIDRKVKDQASVNYQEIIATQTLAEGLRQSGVLTKEGSKKSGNDEVKVVKESLDILNRNGSGKNGELKIEADRVNVTSAKELQRQRDVAGTEAKKSKDNSKLEKFDTALDTVAQGVFIASLESENPELQDMLAKVASGVEGSVDKLDALLPEGLRGIKGEVWKRNIITSEKVKDEIKKMAEEKRKIEYDSKDVKSVIACQEKILSSIDDISKIEVDKNKDGKDIDKNQLEEEKLMVQAYWYVEEQSLDDKVRANTASYGRRFMTDETGDPEIDTLNRYNFHPETQAMTETFMRKIELHLDKIESSTKLSWDSDNSWTETIFVEAAINEIKAHRLVEQKNDDLDIDKLEKYVKLWEARLALHDTSILQSRAKGNMDAKDHESMQSSFNELKKRDRLLTKDRIKLLLAKEGMDMLNDKKIDVAKAWNQLQLANFNYRGLILEAIQEAKINNKPDDVAKYEKHLAKLGKIYEVKTEKNMKSAVHKHTIYYESGEWDIDKNTGQTFKIEKSDGKWVRWVMDEATGEMKIDNGGSLARDKNKERFVKYKIGEKVLLDQNWSYDRDNEERHDDMQKFMVKKLGGNVEAVQAIKMAEKMLWAFDEMAVLNWAFIDKDGFSEIIHINLFRCDDRWKGKPVGPEVTMGMIENGTKGFLRDPLGINPLEMMMAEEIVGSVENGAYDGKKNIDTYHTAIMGKIADLKDFILSTKYMKPEEANTVEYFKSRIDDFNKLDIGDFDGVKEAVFIGFIDNMFKDMQIKDGWGSGELSQLKSILTEYYFDTNPETGTVSADKRKRGDRDIHFLGRDFNEAVAKREKIMTGERKEKFKQDIEERKEFDDDFRERVENSRAKDVWGRMMKKTHPVRTGILKRAMIYGVEDFLSKISIFGPKKK